MSFRKRNVGLSRNAQDANVMKVAAANESEASFSAPAGTRPSPIDGRLTTSSGAASLDGLLAGHAGLPLGGSLVLEESGTTDYAGSLLRYFAAEGIVHGHHLHLIGLGERWIRDLPGVVGAADEIAEQSRDIKPENGQSDRMKIAWRYENLGKVEDKSHPRRTINSNRASPAALSRASAESSTASTLHETRAFCHMFDLAKRLEIPSTAKVTHYPVDVPNAGNALQAIIRQLEDTVKSAATHQIHRLVIPSFLSPASYPPQASQPQIILPFLHALRSLHRQCPDSLVSMMTLPISLYPRVQSNVRWTELLADSVIELTPFPHRLDDYSAPGISLKSGVGSTHDEQPQGMVKVHKLPVYHERGGGGGVRELGSDLAFTMSRRRFVIKPYSLPPADGDTESQKEAGSLTKDQIEF